MDPLEQPEGESRVRTTITLPRSLDRRIRRAAAVNKRTYSSEIEYGIEGYLEEFEKAHSLTSKHLRDDWPD